MNNQYPSRPLPANLKALVSNKLTIAAAAVIVLFVFGEIISPGFLSFGHVMSMLRLAVFLGIVALGQSLVVMAGGEGIDLSVGSVLSLGVVIASSLLNGKNGNIPAALAGAIGAGFVIGLVNGFGVSYIGIPPLIMTLAMASVVEGLSLIYTGGYPSGNAPPLLESLGNGRIVGIPYVVMLWVIIIAAATFLLFRKRWGSVLFGVGSNSITAELSGINVKRFRMFVYGICSAITGFAGFLVLGYTGTPYLNLGAPYLMSSIAAVAVGGISLSGGSGSYVGAAIGCILLITLSSILVALQTTEAVRQIVYGSLLFIIVVAYTKRRAE
ncbi:MAG: ABC transporter permease [Spirochaetales bacterium]|nr:MAG: ABC transporter permease [Spirochaetales bacterium]